MLMQLEATHSHTTTCSCKDCSWDRINPEGVRRLLKDRLVEFVEKYFPKGNKGRGKATVMMSLFLIEFMEILTQHYRIGTKAH